MKRILIVCLLGMGLLLPLGNITAKEIIVKETIAKRVLDISVEEDLVVITSDVNSGTINTVKIFNSNKVKVIEETCSGYYHATDVSGLSSGLYSVVVITSVGTFSSNIYL